MRTLEKKVSVDKTNSFKEEPDVVLVFGVESPDALELKHFTTNIALESATHLCIFFNTTHN